MVILNSPTKKKLVYSEVLVLYLGRCRLSGSTVSQTLNTFQSMNRIHHAYYYPIVFNLIRCIATDIRHDDQKLTLNELLSK